MLEKHREYDDGALDEFDEDEQYDEEDFEEDIDEEEEKE